MAQVVARTATCDDRIDSNNSNDSTSGSRSAFDNAQSMRGTHSARNEYPLNVSVDFTQLRVRAFACVALCLCGGHVCMCRRN